MFSRQTAIDKAEYNMITYISFLRGVNMTGHNSVKMTDLAALYNNLGLVNPETYIQSGNVIFSCASSIDKRNIASVIETALLSGSGYEIPVLIRTLDEIRNLFYNNPFLSEENFDPAKMAVIFLYEEVTESQIMKVADVNYPPDKFRISGSEIYIYCPDGFGKTKIYTNFFERKMKVTGTARNWKTILSLLELAENRL